MKKIKNKVFLWFCKKLNWHRYLFLFNGYPAFSNHWYQVSICPHCRKTKVDVQKTIVLKPTEYQNNKNYLSYNKKLNPEYHELARQFVYAMNKSLKKSSKKTDRV